MSDELPDNLRPVVDFFGLPNRATVIKDFYVVRAIKAVAAVDASPFTLVFGGGTALARAHTLRPTIQVEMTHASLRLASVDKPVNSFVAEALSHPPEVASIPCVSLTETAAEKFVSLTRRTAMERAGLSRAPDPTLVRHIYDLHAMRENIDIEQLARLVPLIAASDAEEFRNQYPAFAADIIGETRSAIIALQSDDLYRQRYNEFLAAMVYGDQTDFRLAVGTVLRFAETVFENTATHVGNS